MIWMTKYSIIICNKVFKYLQYNCLTIMYRFTVSDIQQLLSFLKLDTILWQTQYQPSFKLALCLVLIQQLFSQQLFQLFNLFGRSEFYLSTVYNNIIKHLCLQYWQMLQWHSSLQYWWLQWYACAIKRVEEWTGEETIWSFIDETFQVTYWSTENQRFFYSGYKKHHSFKYQDIVCSDSLIESIAEPYESKMNNLQIVRKS